jgi:AraC-like DNA-binding protein
LHPWAYVCFPPRRQVTAYHNKVTSVARRGRRSTLRVNRGYASRFSAQDRPPPLSWGRTVAANVVGDIRLKDEPLLAEVFTFIEERYRGRVSLKDVARAVSLSPGHLTTVVRRKTGRPVQEWISERRMVEARRLLVETDLTVEEVGRRVGYGDAGYFVRSFRRAHGATPLSWRRAGRP